VVAADAFSIIALLKSLAEHPQQLDKVRLHLHAEEIPTTAMMVADYQQIFTVPELGQLTNTGMHFLASHSHLDERLQQPMLTNTGGFIDLMQQLQFHLLAMIDKSPGIHRYSRIVFKGCIRIWVYLPVRFASWYLQRVNR
jgi:hypothetical protein